MSGAAHAGTAQDRAKIAAGKAAIERFVRAGMKIGLGSGTTSHFFVRSLGERVRAGLDITATTTSNSTTAVAAEAGIEITGIDAIGAIDLTIDGPDEIDAQLRMIKGGGGCLLWEKIVAHASGRMITICDETKRVDCLGGFPLPVDVVAFGWVQTRRRVERELERAGIAAAQVRRRERDGAPVTTDSGHYILDCACRRIEQPEELEMRLNMIPGVVENGLFTREADGVVVGRLDGSTHIEMRRQMRRR